ncbi:MAG: hypothetical protein UFA98_01425 [Ruminococcus sp.]|nr:hypothetical protein [Ruminococcus sp.]
MKNLVISDLYPCFCDELRKLDYNIIPTKKINEFYLPEQKHADMQLLKIKDRIFTLENCVGKPERKYPYNVLLNCLYFNDKLYGKLTAVDDSVIAYCKQNGIETVIVNQGYTRCSTLVIAEKAAITADKSIEKALKNDGAEVLLISPGNIVLEGFDYGFIGGAGFADNRTVYFFGDITKHPDFVKISAFTEKYNSKIEILCKKQPLTDIGGAVLL